MSATRNDPSVARSAMGGALTGLLLAGLVGGYLLAFSAAPTGIEADAFAVYLDRSAPAVEVLAEDRPGFPEPRYAINR